jgi:hypothetical protein
MSIEQHDSGPTSNDLLESLIAGRASAELSDPIVGQTAVGVENIENAAAVEHSPSDYPR